MSYRLFDSHLRRASHVSSDMALGTSSGGKIVVIVASTPLAGGSVAEGLPTLITPVLSGDWLAEATVVGVAVAITAVLGGLVVLRLRVVVALVAFGGFVVAPAGMEICNSVVLETAGSITGLPFSSTIWDEVDGADCAELGLGDPMLAKVTTTRRVDTPARIRNEWGTFILPLSVNDERT